MEFIVCLVRQNEGYNRNRDYLSVAKYADGMPIRYSLEEAEESIQKAKDGLGDGTVTYSAGFAIYVGSKTDYEVMALGKQIHTAQLQG